MKKFREFVTEGIAFEHDPKPHVVEPTMNRFGGKTYYVKNRHDWRGEVVRGGTHSTAEDARNHADALNKAHREKHGISES